MKMNKKNNTKHNEYDELNMSCHSITGKVKEGCIDNLLWNNWLKFI